MSDKKQSDVKQPGWLCKVWLWIKRWWLPIAILLITSAGLACALSIPQRVFETPREPANDKSAPILLAQSNLRLAFLYITGGAIAVMGLIETFRKNNNEKLKNDQEKEKNDRDHLRQVRTERRERYTKAVEQLGDEKAPIRMGGVYTLIGLIDEWLEDKSIKEYKGRLQEGQVIINNLCAYIRSPFTLASHYDELSQDSPTVSYKDREQEFYVDKAILDSEKDVRLSIIKEIHDRLQGSEENTPGKWSDFEYDFSGSTFFYPVDLTNSYYKNPTNFNNSYYYRKVNFSGSIYKAQVSFRGSIYKKKVTFSSSKSRSIYRGQADFSSSTYEGQADFSRSTYEKDFIFSISDFRSTYKSEVDFSGSTYQGRADFSRSTYQGRADFSRSTYEKDVIFSIPDFRSTYEKKVIFGTSDFRSTYKSEADFSGSTYQGQADFSGSTYEKKVIFSISDSPSTYKSEADFSGSTYQGQADFSGSTYEKKVIFSISDSPSAYKSEVDFSGSTYQGRADFSHSTYQGLADFSDSIYCGKADFIVSTYQWADFSGSIFYQEIYFGEVRDSSSFSRFTECAAIFYKENFYGKKFYEKIYNQKTLFGSPDNNFTVENGRGYPIYRNLEGLPLGCKFLTSEQKEYLEYKFQEIEKTNNKLLEVKNFREKAEISKKLQALNEELHEWREKNTTVKVEDIAAEDTES